jgi:hypothetical protein
VMNTRVSSAVFIFAVLIATAGWNGCATPPSLGRWAWYYSDRRIGVLELSGAGYRDGPEGESKINGGRKEADPLAFRGYCVAVERLASFVSIEPNGSSRARSVRSQ